jgi:hypothetical protein
LIESIINFLIANSKMSNNELSRGKFNLVVCEMYNKFIHGYDENSYDDVKGHYLCIHVSRNKSIFHERDTESDLEDDEYESEQNYENGECHINDIVDLHSAYYINYVKNPTRKHDIIRNYRQIISKNGYIQPHLAEVLNLPSGECVAIIKTMWLKVVQRAWRRLLNQRKEVINKRKNPTALHFREIHGKWPRECSYPSVNGMFWS